jgi:NFACT protein RNA binding domain
MDAVTLDHLIVELRPLLLGRRLGRVRTVGAAAVGFELGGRSLLRLDATPGHAGLYLLERSAPVPFTTDEVAGSTRQAVLHLRKHACGRILSGLDRIPGERALVLGLGRDALIALRLSGASPALTLTMDGEAVCTIGGRAAWPLPPARPEREWDVVSAGEVEEAVARAVARGIKRERAVAIAMPSLGPHLVREIEGSGGSLDELRRRLASARPTVIGPGLPESWTDSAVAPPGAVVLAPCALRTVAGSVIHPASWRSAAALFLAGRLRGRLFATARRHSLETATSEVRRLERLEEHLVADDRGLADPIELRRQAEALLAAPAGLRTDDEVEVADLYRPAQRLRIRLLPGLGIAGTANRLFEKARRVEGARVRLRARLAATRDELVAARAREARVRSVESIAALGEAGMREPAARPADTSGPRHYLTSRGLSILVGRGARENHRLTFSIARPEDYWLHARDVPGAHVILRDPEGRATDSDRREAAEVAAYFSRLREESGVDVHMTARKHLRPGRGGPGHVQIGYAETLRVAPRDPEGRLRRRQSRGV